MPPAKASAAEVDSPMSKLSINAAPNGSTASKKAIADSWEDSESDSIASDIEKSEEPAREKRAKKPSHLAKPSDSYPSAPPPTPLSPQFSNNVGFSHTSAADESVTGRDANSDKRPEKTTQTASRMIAAGLGVRAPQRTEDQKQYDRAMREKEMKSRNQQREEMRRQEEEREKAKQAMWED